MGSSCQYRNTERRDSRPRVSLDTTAVERKSNLVARIYRFNEPDLAEQANLSPSAAASIWSSAMEPLATKNVKLVSPAVSNGVKTADGKPMGVPWLLEFFDACKDCTIDAVALQ